MNNHFNTLIIVVLMMFLVSCGGGGGGDGGTSTSTSSQAPLDSDKDGIADITDTDDDNDGVLDAQDAFPLDKTESIDTDGDGIGNNADTDDDGDGVPDVKDLFPLDKTESTDFDGDGKGDTADTDDDSDGVLDAQDAFPLDKTESIDTDGDGIGNNADTDDDGDGVPDVKDLFPLDKTESADFDGDGKGDSADTDDDNDGILDAVDTTKSIVINLASSISAATNYLHDNARNYLYITHKADKSLSVLDAKSGALIKSIKFEQMPERMFLTADNSKLYVTLITKEHSSYWFDNQLGYVATIDLNLLEKKSTFTLALDPYDLIVTAKGNLVVSGGSGQWTSINAYDSATGVLLGSVNSIREASTLLLSKDENIVYTVSSGNSYKYKYDISGSSITNATEGLYPGYGKLWITPNGKYFITQSGDASNVSDSSLVSHLLSANTQVRDITFDAANQLALLSLTDNSILVVNLTSLELISTIKVFGDVQTAFLADNFLYSVTVQSGVTSIIKQENPCTKCATNTAPKAALTYTPSAGDTTKTYIFDASSSSDPDGDVLSYRWDIDSDGIWDTAFSSNAKFEKRFVIPGTKYVRVQVKDTSGSLSMQTLSVDVVQGIDAGVAVVDSIPNFLNFSTTEVITNSNNTKLYIADRNAKRVYIVDLATGNTERYFAFEQMPERLALSPDGSRLFVTLLFKDHASYSWYEDRAGYLAVIDTTKNTYIRTLDLKKDPYDVVALSNEKIVVKATTKQNSSVEMYDVSTGLSVAVADGSYYENGRLAANTAGSVVYNVESDIKKYDVIGNSLSLNKVSIYANNQRIGAQVWPTPNGKYLITQAGDIFTATDLQFVIAKTPINISIKNVAFDPQNKIAFLVLSNGTIDVINLDSLESIKKITTTGDVSNISVKGSDVYMLTTLKGISNIIKLDPPCPNCATNTAPVAAFDISPTAGDTSTTFTFDASTSSDAESTSLLYRWDTDGDGVWDNAFSSITTASRRFSLSGEKTIKLQVKDSMGLVATLSKKVTVVQGVDNGVVVTDSIANQLKFATDNVITDSARAKIYAIDKANKRLYIVNVLTGFTEKYIEFEYLPEKMSLSPDGEKLFITLLYKDHNTYQWGDTRSGFIAVIDLQQQAHTNTFLLANDPYDILSTSDAKLIISNTGDSSGAASVYDAVTGQFLANATRVGRGVFLVQASSGNFFYAVNNSYSIIKFDSSTADPTSISESLWSSRVRIGSTVWATPDGTSLITQGGDIISATDFTLVAALTEPGVTINTVTFDAQQKIAVLSLSNSKVDVINLVSNESIKNLTVAGSVKALSIINSTLYIVANNGGVITLTQQSHPCPLCGANKQPVVALNLTPVQGNTTSTYVFDASTSSDPENEALSYRWDTDGDGKWDTSFASKSSYSTRFTLAGTKTIAVQIKDSLGLVKSISRSFTVEQGIDSGTAVIGATAFSLDFIASYNAVDQLNGKLYSTDRGAKRLYITDIATGLTEKYFEFDFMPERMAISPDNEFLYVALPIKDHSSYWWTNEQTGYIAVIDLAAKTYIQTLAVAIDPFDLAVAANQKLLVTSGSGQWTSINAYSLPSGDLLGSTGIRQQSRVVMDPAGKWLFSADTDSSPSDIRKYDVSGVGVIDLGDSPYHGSLRMNGRVWVTPNGKNLITAGGDVFLSVDMTFVKSMTAQSVGITSLAFNSADNTVNVLGSDKKITSYSLSDFSSTLIFNSTLTDPREVFTFSGSTYAIDYENGKFKIKKL